VNRRSSAGDDRVAIDFGRTDDTAEEPALNGSQLLDEYDMNATVNADSWMEARAR